MGSASFNRPASDISEDVLMVIRRVQFAGARFDLRVVAYIVDGVLKAPRIEKRRYTIDGDGWKKDRTASLDFGDAAAIVQRWPEIKALWVGK